MDPITALLALLLAGEPVKYPNGYKLNEHNRVVEVDCNDASKFFDPETNRACGRPEWLGEGSGGDTGSSSQ